MPLARETTAEAAVLDSFAECMGHEHRRKVLFTLHQAEEGERLVVPDDFLDQDVDRERLVIELTHRHLPKLQDAGYVEWDRARGEIREGEDFERLEPLLEVLTDYYEYIVETFDPNQTM